MTSDTHDNGREEQWRAIGDRAIEVVEEDAFQVAMISVKATMHGKDAPRIRDAILAARAQAGLAQRLADDMRERGHKAQFNNPTLSPRAALAFALTGAEWEWLAEFDALTAGPTAAAE